MVKRINDTVIASPPSPVRPELAEGLRAGSGAKQSRSKIASSALRPPRNDGKPEPPVWIEVDLSAIQHNLRQIRRFLPSSVKILGVVKANAYGHGLVPVARCLMEAGVPMLGVATVAEGVALRQAGISSRILVLGQLLPEEGPQVVQHELIQAIGDDESARALTQAAARLEKGVCVHLKVDTGMGRYGVWHEQALSLARRIAQLPGLKLEGILTHLSMAGQSEEATEEQLQRFSRVAQQFSKAKIPAGIRHAANSIGLIKFPSSHWDLVRTGLMLYGASPVRDGALPFVLKPALALKSRVRFLKNLPQGQAVSYGGTYRAARPTQVATIPVGYAHGYSRALSNKAQVLIRGVRAPVIGRITMEDLICDVTNLAGVQVGDEAVLLGSQGKEEITAAELARHARTIPYEILAGLSASLPRRYGERAPHGA